MREREREYIKRERERERERKEKQNENNWSILMSGMKVEGIIITIRIINK